MKIAIKVISVIYFFTLFFMGLDHFYVLNKKYIIIGMLYEIVAFPMLVAAFILPIFWIFLLIKKEVPKKEGILFITLFIILNTTYHYLFK